jgi:regulator of sigma E protease
MNQLFSFSTLAAFLLALGPLIAFHEFGHYLAARLCGVKVLRYCLGFGSPILMRRWGRDQTEWAVAAFPLGGYVKLLGQDPEEAVPAADAHRSFSNQNVWKRMAIIVAGPLANFILAITVYWVLNLHGIEEPVARVAAPAAGTPAAQAQLAGGDLITRMDGAPVASWSDLNWRLLQAADAHRMVKLETRNTRGEIAEPVLDLSRLGKLDLEGNFMGQLGFELYHPAPRISAVLPGSPAEQGGLRAGDALLAVEGRAVASAAAFIAQMRTHQDQPLRLSVLRAGQRVELTVTPRAVESEGSKFVGINAKIDPALEMTLVRYGVLDALDHGVSQTWEMSVFSLKMLGKMVTGQISWHNLSGVVTIADVAGKTARLGLPYYLNFIALVSVSLGVLNLLPIPLLDGGYLMYYLAEIIRGKPVSERVMEIGSKFGLTIVIVSMALALYNDIHRLLAG